MPDVARTLRFVTGVIKPMGKVVTMKKTLAIVIMCVTFALAMGLVGCGGSSSGSAASSASGSAASSTASTSAASASSTSASSASASASSSASSESSALERSYYEKVREMESTRNDYVESFKNEAKNYPAGMEEALNYILDEDHELMTRTILRNI
jgi:hypothetical protein